MAQDGNNILGEVLQAIGGGLAAAAGPEIFQPFIESVSKERERRVAQAKRTRNNRVVLEARMADPEWASVFTEAMGTKDPGEAITSAEGLAESELRLIMSGVGDQLAQKGELDSAFNQIARDYADDGFPVPTRPEGKLTRGYINDLREGHARLAGSRAQSEQKRNALVNRLNKMVDVHAQDPLGGAMGGVLALDDIKTDGLSPEDATMVEAAKASAARQMSALSTTKEESVNQAAFNKGDYSAYAADPQTRFSKSEPDMGPTLERLGPVFDQGRRMSLSGTLGEEGDEAIIGAAAARFESVEEAMKGMKREEFAGLLGALHRSQGSFPYKSEKREAFRQKTDFESMLQNEGIAFTDSMGTIQEVGGRLTFVPNTNNIIDQVYKSTGNSLVTENDRRAWSEQSSLPPEVKNAVIAKSRKVSRETQSRTIVDSGAPDFGLEFDNTDAAEQFIGLIDPDGGKIATIDNLGAAFKPVSQSTVIGATRVGATTSVRQIPGLEALGWKEAPATEADRKTFLPFVDALTDNDLAKLNKNARGVVNTIRTWDKDQRAAFIKQGEPVPSPQTFRKAALDVVLPPAQGQLAESYAWAAAMENRKLEMGLGDFAAETQAQLNAAKYAAMSEAYNQNAAAGTEAAAAAVTAFADMALDTVDLDDEDLTARIQSFLEKEQDLFGGGGANVTDVVLRLNEAETMSAKFSAFEDYLATHKAVFVANDPAQTARRAANAEVQLQSVRNIRALAASIMEEGRLDAANPSAAGFGRVDLPQSQWAKYDDPEDRAFLLAFTLLSSPRR